MNTTTYTNKLHQNRTTEYPLKQKYCNNCHKYGHPYHQCKMPITSYGLIVFRKRPTDNINASNLDTSIIEYLMIRRRDTLGFIDFMRGKYSVYDKSYIVNMIVQMTVSEKQRLLAQPFGDIWRELWGGAPANLNMQYRNEEQISRDKFNTLRSGVLLKHDFYTLDTLVQFTFCEAKTPNVVDCFACPGILQTTMQDHSPTQVVSPCSGNSSNAYLCKSGVLHNNHTNNNTNMPIWEYAEWGFPKGRRNYQEKDYDCAVREFCEETGYTKSLNGLIPIQNIMPFEEIFMGSNYKSYKHKYYLTYMPYEESIRECAVQSSEVSCAEWKTYEDCMASIRHYNVEKKRVLENVHQTILQYL